MIDHKIIYALVKSNNNSKAIKVISDEVKFEITFEDGSIKTENDFTKDFIENLKLEYENQVQSDLEVKKSAHAKLAALGLSADEIAALSK